MVKTSLDLGQLRTTIKNWLEVMAQGLKPGRFSFCATGSNCPTKEQQGQMPTCFAMKIAWQTGIWHEWSAERREGCISFIQSFQRPDGYFDDPWLAANSKTNYKTVLLLLLGRIGWSEIANRSIQNLRAETRQSASTLLMVGASPKYSLPLEIKTTGDVDKYFQTADWVNPWSAGSHVSHQLFLLSINHQRFNQPDNYEEIKNYIFQKMDKLYDSKTGTWFSGNCSDSLKINGAMKIYSGLQWVDFPYPDAKALLDFSLQQPFKQDGCGFLNRLFLLQQALKGGPVEYRSKEIKTLAKQALMESCQFIRKDGGFSFYRTAAQTSYYSAKVSSGNKISDLHGTVMMTWSIAVALSLLGEDYSQECQIWQCQRA